MSYSLSSTSSDPELELQSNSEPTYDDLKDEFDAVHARIRELEFLNDRARQRIAELEQERTDSNPNSSTATPGAVAIPLLQLLQQRYRYANGDLEGGKNQTNDEKFDKNAEAPSVVVSQKQPLDHTAGPSDPGVAIAAQA
ncbi:hypothetical protein FRC07_014667 [Ceratobasidium sp. 392]|nr:hypothetical protein FRC07_014667 [Ceratobasidium sp. 392]